MEFTTLYHRHIQAPTRMCAPSQSSSLLGRRPGLCRGGLASGWVFKKKGHVASCRRQKGSTELPTGPNECPGEHKEMLFFIFFLNTVLVNRNNQGPLSDALAPITTTPDDHFCMVLCAQVCRLDDGILASAALFRHRRHIPRASLGAAPTPCAPPCPPRNHAGTTRRDGARETRWRDDGEELASG